MIRTLWRQWTCTHKWVYSMRITSQDYRHMDTDEKPELLVYECKRCFKVRYEPAHDTDDFKDLGSDHGKKK